MTGHTNILSPRLVTSSRGVREASTAQPATSGVRKIGLQPADESATCHQEGQSGTTAREDRQGAEVTIAAGVKNHLIIFLCMAIFLT